MTALPADFVLGAATAAYQIEGAAAEDGRTPSIWDTFSRTPGKVLEGHTGDVACDHYHRLDEDLDMIKDLGLQAYRFSVSWSRVLPNGGSRPNPQGLDFYNRLVDGLLERDIEPWLTLYHWDLPQELEDAGGWPNRDVAQRFCQYAVTVHDALGDRVKRWTTFNEPWCSSYLGYAAGVHAPGRTDDTSLSVPAQHHLLLAHGLAARELKTRGAEVGITLNLYAVSPETDSAADADAARRIDAMCNRIWLEPVLLGRYPDDVKQDLAPLSDFSFVRDGDLDVIKAPLDFLGVNYYSRHVVSGSDAAERESHHGEPSAYPGSEFVQFVHREGVPVTAMDWEIDAQGLYEVLQQVAGYTSLPIYITENGAAFEDKLDADGTVNDQERIDYFEGHLGACARAIEAGVPLRGYFAWSLMDNFEWAWGYTRRFGMVYVDYEDAQRRVPKASAHWYSDVIRNR
ncbi:GH1 family beta-glucosidase [Virgisporangium aurantiacum]|uniref:Beta-glucosidase n=1 Tax=Virgisporangium aurantiacum TaxID=175570 RepID=A0A8J3YYB5_9ACTN|nr:GH1 family beta-glucosidase [Virgisporangium aurantiacum]GIJ52792.1 beta-glucosidase [Virgisporangium aurantiacum]